MAASNAPTTPLGSSGIDSWSGGGWGFPVNSLEHVPDMVFPASIQTLAKMRTDATIASILEAYYSAIIAADWRISPRGADPTLVKICADSLGIPIAGQKVDDEGPVRRRGVKWHEHCRLALLHLPFGFMPFEPVYEVRPDGYAYLSALPERMPSTVVGIDVNDDGTLKSITQTAPANAKANNNFGGVEIPAERLLFYVLNREGANWQGTPLIRRCYTDWILKIEGKRANAIGLKRWSSGIPVAEPLPGTNPTPAQIAQAQAMASNARGGEFAGAVPVGFKLRIIGIEGTLPDALPTLQYYDSQLSRSCLTSLLDLGNTATGSRALGDNFADILGRSLAAIGQTMAETATTLCERLTDYNFGPEAIVPAVTCGDITMSNSVIAEAIVGLATAGVIRVDAGIESYVRQALHLPAAETPYPPAAGKAPAAPVAATTVPAQVAAAGWQPWVQAAGGTDAHTGPERKLVDWFLRGADGQIHWGTHGDFEECLLIAGKHMPPAEAKGFCSNRHKEATGEWPGPNAHKGIHAAAGDPAQPSQPYRQTTPAEQQAGIDPQQIDADQDALVAAGVAIMATVTAIWAASLTTQVASALGAGIAGLSKLSVDSGTAYAKLTGLADQAVDSGIRQVLAETGQAGGPKLAPDEIPSDRQTLLDAIRSLVDLAAQGFASAVGREATRLAGPSADAEQVAHDAVTTVQANQTPIRDFVTSIVARAMGAGRMAAQQAAMAASGTHWIPMASAIRDVNSCQSCLDNDQHEYPSLAAAAADFPSGHYSACLGRSRCRCVIALRPVAP